MQFVQFIEDAPELTSAKVETDPYMNGVEMYNGDVSSRSPDAAENAVILVESESDDDRLKSPKLAFTVVNTIKDF